MLGKRIPESLWGLAVELATSCGVHRTSKALGLDYYSLKKRIELSASGDRLRSPRATPFVELTVPAKSSGSECVLELEDASGAKMRVHLKGVETPDLAALSRAFWGLDQ
jgi:hypothetical protein